MSAPYYGSSTTQIGVGWAGVCYVSITSGLTGAPLWGTNCGGRVNNAATPIGFVASTTETAKRNVNSTGWIPVNLNQISSGAPISAYPVDPVSPNASSSFYSYSTDGSGGFVLKARLESTKFASSSENDGGPRPDYYEVGTDPGLDL